MIELKTFKTGAEMRAHYAEVRARLGAQRRPPPTAKPAPAPAPPAPPPLPKLTPSHRILLAVSQQFKIDVADLRSATRTAQVVEARNVAMYLMRTLIGLSLERIGSRVGHRDHTTVLHSLNSIEVRIIEEPEFAAKISQLQRMLMEPP